KVNKRKNRNREYEVAADSQKHRASLAESPGQQLPTSRPRGSNKLRLHPRRPMGLVASYCREQRIRVSIEIPRHGACSKIEPVTENQFGDQMIGGARYSYPQPEINFPLRRKIQIHGWKNLVLLLRHGMKPRERPHGAVIFQTAGNFRREVVAEFEIRRED